MKRSLIIIGISYSLCSLLACSGPSPEDLAERFCACSEHLKISELPYDQWKRNKEGFRYPKELDNCFGKTFSERGDELQGEARQQFLEDFQRATLERCPQHINHLFE